MVNIKKRVAAAPVATPAPVKRGPGRPRKNPLPAQPPAQAIVNHDPDIDDQAAEPQYETHDSPAGDAALALDGIQASLKDIAGALRDVVVLLGRKAPVPIAAVDDAAAKRAQDFQAACAKADAAKAAAAKPAPAPKPKPVPAPAPEPEPEPEVDDLSDLEAEAPAPVPTIDELRAAMQVCATKHGASGREVIVGLLKQHGGDKLSNIPEENRAALLGAFNG